METEASNIPARIEHITMSAAELLTTSVRRVQITGGSSFMITLPKEWADRIELKNKDHILIREQPDGSLVLKPM